MMKNAKLHAGVFCVGLALTALISRFSPLWFSPYAAFTVFALAFFAYLGVSMLMESRGRSKDGDPK